MGHSAEYLTDPRAALSAAAEFNPDAAFLDVDMPHMNGFELVAALRADSGIPKDLPVIFLTADADADGRARELGAQFLEKPIRLEELLAAVARHLPLPRR